jgi:UDP-N-acetylmuramate dehydrogenase
MKCERGVPIANVTTFKNTGTLEFLYSVDSPEALLAVIESLPKGTPRMVLGGGSNTLFVNDSYQGCVIKNEIRGISVEEETESSVLVRVGAGEDWDEFVAYALKNRWYGLENLSFIPGTVGASPIQNIGAYGIEVGVYIDSVEAVQLYSATKARFTHTQCKFDYRDSYFKSVEGRTWCITYVYFKLMKNPSVCISYADVAKRFSGGSKPTPETVREVIGEIRRAKFPDLQEVGTAGSYFKNPILTQEEAKRLTMLYPGMPVYPYREGLVKVSCAWILDVVCGLKGYIQGNAGLYEKQPLVLTLKPLSSAQEIKKLEQYVKECVYAKTGITLLPEVEKYR